MTVKELFNFIKGVRPGFAFTDAQLTVWLNEIEGHVQTDIWLLEPAVDETQTGLVEYDSTIDTETGEMVDANHELLVPFPWNKLYRYFLLMSIDLANGEYQRYANSYELFNEAYEEYAGWYAQHVSPANGDAITRGYYISAYQFAARGGYTGTEEEFYEALGGIGTMEARITQHVDAEIADLSDEIQYRLGSSTVYNVQDYGILPDTGEDLYDALFDFLHGDVSTTGGVVYFPVGRYVISDTLLIPANTIFLGEGRGTEIYYTGQHSSFGVGLTNGGDNVGIANMTVNDNNTEPHQEGHMTGGIGFSTYDFNKWTTKNITATATSPQRDTANLFAENIWSDSGYVLQTEERAATEERLLGTIKNVRYRNIFAPHSRVSLYGRQNVTNAVIENVVCAYLRVGNTSNPSNLCGLADVNVKNVTAGRARICARNANVDGLVIDPAYKYDTIPGSYAVLLSSGTQDVFTSRINLSNSRIDATGYDYAFQKGNADVSMVNVSCKNYNISAWHEDTTNASLDVLGRTRFVNCDFNSECDITPDTSHNSSTIHGEAYTSNILADKSLTKTPVVIEEKGGMAAVSTAGSGLPYDRIVVDIQARPASETNGIKHFSGFNSVQVEVVGTGAIYEIVLPEAAGTVFTGTLDITNGILTLKRRLLTFTGDEDYWTILHSGFSHPAASCKLTSSTSSHSPWNKPPLDGVGECSHFNSGTINSTNDNYVFDVQNSHGRILFRNAVTDPGTDRPTTGANVNQRINEWRDWLREQYSNGTPLQVWYEPTTDTVYKVSPVRIIKTDGDKYIKSNAGPVSVRFLTSPYMAEKRKELNILVLGNSFSQDSFAYLPPVLNELLPDYRITYGVAYRSSCDIATHVNMYKDVVDPQETPRVPKPDGALNTWPVGTYTFFNLFSYGVTKWTRYTGTGDNPQDGYSLTRIMDLRPWDIVYVQPRGSVAESAIMTNNVTPARELLDILRSLAKNPFSFAMGQWLSDAHNSSADPAAPIWDRGEYVFNQGMVNAMSILEHNLPISFYIPIGTGIQNARTNTNLQNLGTGAPDGAFANPGNMLYDDISDGEHKPQHQQAGIPALISAYTIALKILEFLGMPYRTIYKSSFVPSTSNCIRLNTYKKAGMTTPYPMTHGDSQDDYLTPENIFAAQQIAVFANKFPTVITDCSWMQTTAVTPPSL